MIEGYRGTGLRSAMRKVLLNSTGRWLFGVGGVAAATAVATIVATRDDAYGKLSLGCLSPVMSVAEEVGWWLLRNPVPWITRLGALVGVVAVVAGSFLWWRNRPGIAREMPPVLVALGLALLGQVFFLHGYTTIGSMMYLEAVVVIVVGRLLGNHDAGAPATESFAAPPTWGEAGALLAIGLVAVFFRYYALNRLLDFFEGELSPFMVGATNIQGMLLANIGWGGPWAPLGLLYYLPIWAMNAVAGSTVLAVRMGSAVIGMLTLIVVFLVVREILGRTAALWSAALMAVDTLQVGWGRSDMHPHASTAWPGILLYGATVRALTTGATGWYVAVMLLMGLSWHQYPSGQFVVIVPVIAFLVEAGRVRGFVRDRWRGGLLILGGLLLWVFGYPIAHFLAVGRPTGPLEYVSRLGPRLLGGSDVNLYTGLPFTEFVGAIAKNLRNLVSGLFIEAPFVFHQTIIPEIDGMTRRALPWFVVACAVVGLTVCVLRFRERWSPPLLALVAAGILPAVLSDEAWLKRASLLYVVLIILAAVPLAIVTDGLRRALGAKTRWVAGAGLWLAFVLWSSVWVHLWFSGREFDYGVAAETTIVEALDRHLEPNTLLIASLWGDYIEGEVTYLLHDAVVKRAPMVLYVADPLVEGWRTLLAFPREALSGIARRPWYWLWLGLGKETQHYLEYHRWSRVVYLIENRPGVEKDFEVLADRCPDLMLERVFVGVDDEVINGEVWMRYHMWIARCDGHRGLRTPRFAVPALP